MKQYKNGKSDERSSAWALWR